MRKKRWHRHWSLLLTICLMTSLLPLYATAEQSESTLVVTASYTNSGDRLSHVHDGIISYSSMDPNRWTAYGSPNAQDWIEFDYGVTTKKDVAAIYFYSDGGGVQVPTSYEIEYWTGAAWASAVNQTRTPAEPAASERNMVQFEAVSSSKFRVVFTHRPGSKTGATEFVLHDSETEGLPTSGIPRLGQVSASYTYRTDDVTKVHDGIVSYSEAPKNRWTAYESPHSTDWVQTIFEAPTTRDVVGVFLFSDGGGVQAPSAIDVQYLNGVGEWTTVPNQAKTPEIPQGNALNLIQFDPVTAQKFRILVTHSSAKAGITEIQYIDSTKQSLPAEPDAGEATASYTNNGDNVAHINDGIVSYGDFPRNRWTAYGSATGEDWVQTKYDSAFSKNAAGIYFFDDGGGVVAPAAYDVQYWDDGEWKSVPNQTREPAQPAGNRLNLVTFDHVISDTFRVVVTHRDQHQKTGITEISYVDMDKEPGPIEPPIDESALAIKIVSPAVGSTVNGAFELHFVAPEMKNVMATVWRHPDDANPDPNGYRAVIAESVEPNSMGEGYIGIDADLLPHGPLTILLDAWDSEPGDPEFTRTTSSYVQFFNEGGIEWNKGVPDSPPPAAADMKLVYADDFNGPLSVSKTGRGTTYTSVKPDWPNGSHFGEAIFNDPTDSVNPFAIMADEYLRIRVTKAPEGYVDPMGWHRQYIGGLLSSVNLDGEGIVATNGYFEAKMQMPAGKGAWPAFWLMSQDSTGENRRTSTAEIDIVESYGHSVQSACQAYHWWEGIPGELHDTKCGEDKFTFADNASTWHIYAARVTETEIIYYIDDIEVWRHPSFEQANTPLYFMVNLALGGGWPIELSQYNDQIDLYVDYIRVYEPDESTPTPTATPTPTPTATPTPTPTATSAPTATPKIETSLERASVVAKTSAISSQGTAIVEWTKAQWEGLQTELEAAKADKLVIQPQQAVGLSAVLFKLPAEVFQAGGPAEVEVRTEYGTVLIPAGAIADAGATAVELRIEGGMAGGRPSLTLSVTVDGKALSATGKQVRITVPYNPPANEAGDPEKIVALGPLPGPWTGSALASSYYDSESGAVAFEGDAVGTYRLTYASDSFADIGSVGWAALEIEALAARGIIKGVSAGQFQPERQIRRADFVLMLARMFGWTAGGGTAFADVSDNAYFASALTTARELGIATGGANGEFRPHDVISRQEMITFAARAMGRAGIAPDSAADLEAAYGDAYSIAPYARASIAELTAAGIVQGSEGLLRPEAPSTRAEAAKLLFSILKAVRN